MERVEWSRPSTAIRGATAATSGGPGPAPRGRTLPVEPKLEAFEPLEEPTGIVRNPPRGAKSAALEGSIPRAERGEARTLGAEEFRPARLLAGAARQTVVGTLLPVRYPRSLPPPVRQSVVVPGNGSTERLAAIVTRAPAREPRPVGRLLLLHGMGGSASSRYMLRTTEEAHHRGWEVARASFRGADLVHPDGAHFHNAERTEDVSAFIEQIRWSPAAESVPLAAVGFSLGGAVLLKYLSEAGSSTPVAAAAAVAAPLDLGACLTALERPKNWVYHRYFVRRMRAQIAPKVRASAGRLPRLTRDLNTVRLLDTLYTAPDAGYPNAEAYYEGASVLPVMSKIEAPCLLLGSRDDPFIPGEIFDRVRGQNSRLQTVMTSAGGHVGFLEVRGFWISFWAARAILGWLEDRITR